MGDQIKRALSSKLSVYMWSTIQLDVPVCASLLTIKTQNKNIYYIRNIIHEWYVDEQRVQG